MTIVEVQQMPKIAKIDCRVEFSCLKWTVYNGWRKVCVINKTDSDKLTLLYIVIETLYASKMSKWD